MKIVEVNRFEKIFIYYDVEGVPATAISEWSDLQVIPDRVEVTWTRGELSEVNVIGFRTLKNGTVSGKVRHVVETYRSWSRELWPEWLTGLVESSR